MIVRAARDDLVAAARHGVRERLRVRDDLLLVLLKLRRCRLLQRCRERCDGVIVGTTLQTREDGEVEFRLNIVVHRRFLPLRREALALAVEDHRTARPAQRFVRRRRHHVGVIKRRRDDARRDEATDVRHIGEEPRAVRVGGGAEAVVIEEARVRRGPGDEEVWTHHLCLLIERIVVDAMRRGVHAVREGFEVRGDGGDLLRLGLVAVREVTAVREIEREDPVVRLQQRGVDLEVRRAPRERLAIHAPLRRVEIKGRERALLAKILDLVDELVAAVVPRAGVPLGVLV